MHIDELVLEVTRKCNASCRHCLRGEPQDVTIRPNTIDFALFGVTSIGIITFTGGEPTLAVDMIQYAARQIISSNIPLDGFYVVTNGKEPSLDLVHVLIDLYGHCEYSDEGTATLTLSKDQYHEEAIKDTKAAHKLYSALRFYHPEYRRDRIQVLVNEGRAVELNRPAREAILNDLVIETDKNQVPVRVAGTVYVNALGDVITSCDLSYESQEQNKIGNVHDRTLSQILSRYANQN